MQRILDNATIKPASLQIELHVYFQQNELVEFCKANNIIVTAYSPLGSKGIDEFLKKISGKEWVLRMRMNDLLIKCYLCTMC